MQIVIDIDEDRYKDIQRIVEVQLEMSHFQTAEQIIAKGVPLPKGHGKIWEENDIKRSIKNDYQLVTILTGLKMVKPIIEADKERMNENDRPNIKRYRPSVQSIRRT